MCSGRVDLAHVLQAFSKGADGVFIGACHLNECNYVTHGNYHALSMVSLAQKLLEHLGLNAKRLKIEFMSGSESNVFVEGVNSFVKQVKELGPLAEGEGLDPVSIKEKIEEMAKLVPYLKLVNHDKLALRLNTEEEYQTLFTSDEITGLFRDIATYYIDPTKCQACSTCLKNCPADAIVGGKNLIHVIDQEKCIKCGTCLEVCPPRFGAVTKLSGESAPPALPEHARAVVRKSKN